MNMQDKPKQQSIVNKLLMPVFDRLKRIHWFTLLLILILGWSGYQMIRRSPAKYQWVQDGWHQVKQLANTREPSAPVSPAVVAKPIIVPKKTTDEVASKSSEIKQVQPNRSPQTVNDLKVNNNIGAIEQRVVHMETSVKQLNLQMAALQRNARALDSQIRRLNQTITMLSSVTVESPQPNQRTASSEVSSAPSASDKMSSSQPKAKTKVESDYTLHAVIPGRAWLNAPEGKIITVSVGSPLPHYGVVQAIDSTQGVVYCNMGATIKFSTQEY